MGIQSKKNPIKREELEEFKRSLRIGDWLYYCESVPRDDGMGGARMLKVKMQITGIYRKIVTLRLAKMIRSMTIQEALIYNKNRTRPAPEPVKEMPIRERDYKIMDLLYRGLKQVEIAKQMKCSVQTVNDVVRAASDRRKAISARHSQILSLIKKGYGHRDIAKKVGCSNSTVARIKKKYEEVNENE